MPDHPEWRLERYSDEMDPFSSIHWYVMQGNLVIAECEVEDHAQLIIVERERRLAYERVLLHISGMTVDNHDLEAAIDAALKALDQ